MGHGQAANCYPRTDYYLDGYVNHYSCMCTIQKRTLFQEIPFSLGPWIMHMTKTTKPCSNSQLWESTTAISISLGSFMGGSEMKPSKLKNVRTYKKVADLVDH